MKYYGHWMLNRIIVIEFKFPFIFNVIWNVTQSLAKSCGIFHETTAFFNSWIYKFFRSNTSEIKSVKRNAKAVKCLVFEQMFKSQIKNKGLFDCCIYNEKKYCFFFSYFSNLFCMIWIMFSCSSWILLKPQMEIQKINSIYFIGNVNQPFTSTE